MQIWPLFTGSLQFFFFYIFIHSSLTHFIHAVTQTMINLLNVSAYVQNFDAALIFFVPFFNSLFFRCCCCCYSCNISFQFCSQRDCLLKFFFFLIWNVSEALWFSFNIEKYKKKEPSTLCFERTYVCKHFAYTTHSERSPHVSVPVQLYRFDSSIIVPTDRVKCIS